MTSEKPETKWEKLKTTASTKSEKLLVFLMETENQMTIEGNPKNRRRHQDQKTTVFCCETRKTRLKNGPNQTTENPNVPLLKVFKKITLFKCQCTAVLIEETVNSEINIINQT